jgi:hypothetical protein
MYILENPVLQRELLVNLRMARAFVLLLLYQALLAVVVYFAWPRGVETLDLSAEPDAARTLSDLFFVGQYILASLMAPSFAAGTITGEKERKTYEMLLASPLRPAAIVLGKMVASLTHLAVLIFASRSARRLPGADRVGTHLRCDQRRLQQLLQAHRLVTRRFLPADPAPGAARRTGLVLAGQHG